MRWFHGLKRWMYPLENLTQAGLVAIYRLQRRSQKPEFREALSAQEFQAQLDYLARANARLQALLYSSTQQLEAQLQENLALLAERQRLNPQVTSEQAPH